MSTALQPYFDKRDFKVTSEPRGGERAAHGALGFVVQKHAASRLHYDFRLELEGTLKSWAVPKGPSLDPADKRMAVHVEDHPLDYASFEGTIPAGQYGAGQVIVWDRGTWEPLGDAKAGYAAGKLKFRLHGEKLQGGWTLVRMHGRAGERQEPWLLIKERDDAARAAGEFDLVDAMPNSVLSDLTISNVPGAAKAAARKAAPRAVKAVKATKATKTTQEKSVSQRDAKVVPDNKPAAMAEATPSPAMSPQPAGVSIPASAPAVALPDTLVPQLATLAASAPAGPGWIYEIKFDGYRLLARIDGDAVRLFTRNGNDWTTKLNGLATDVRKLGLPSGWLDGEIVVLGANGAPDFNALQNAFDSTRTEQIRYCVFDLPFYDGRDLRQLPLIERRALLSQVLDEALHGAPPGRIQFSQDFDASPEELLQNACRMRLEGVIGKRADSPYVARRSPTWIKLKCTQRQEFVIGGYTDPQGARAGIGSLLLGIHDEAGNLRFAGGVGSGFDEEALTTIRHKLDAIGAAATPFVDKPRDVRGHWVEPTLIAEVSFGEWTRDGRVRHAVFHGLRADKTAAAIVREQAEPAEQVAKEVEAEARRLAPEPARKPSRSPADQSARKSARSNDADPTAEALGIRISNPDRVIDPSTGATKVDLVDHYLHVARLMLPHLSGRPASLVRAPAGIGGQLFFQRHGEGVKIPDLTRLDPALAPGRAAMIELDSFTALIGAAQANVVEFHTWNAKSRRVDQPDRMIFDLDPGEGVSWLQIQEGTNLTRALLKELGLESFLKTSGGKGLHVVVPIVPKENWDTVKGLSQAVVKHLADAIPERFVAKSGPKNRVGRIFVDYLRNGFGATTACAYSARARPGLGVSIPCSWDELADLTGGAHWTVANLHDRLEEPGDPWSAYAGTRQTLARAMKTLGFERMVETVA